MRYFIAALAALTIYLIPWSVALVRRSRRTTAVFWVNLLLGWTVVGFFFALYMAIDSERRHW